MALEIVKIFPVHIREALANDTWKAGLEEIRVRAYVSCLLPADMRAAIG